ncbi:MAG: tRNA (adenosine(37)-N6)-threonylcarbamoyltransferase complex dimerization subunit type 1 TsaB, partial [Betaproteobacteria bacterium]
MKLLALDTSTERLCLALCQDGRVHGHEEPGGALASQRLLPAAQALLQRHGLNWGDLDGLAYGEGPGAFTGLRGACAAVQGLALGLDLRAVSVPSLLIVAEDARQRALAHGLLQPQGPCTVAVAVDARMGQVYDERMRWSGKGWTCLDAPQVRAPEEVAQVWWALRSAACTEPPWILAGSGLALMPEAEAVGRKGQTLVWGAAAPHPSAPQGGGGGVGGGGGP